MNTKCILLMLLAFINYAAGDLLQVSSAPINTTRIIRNITGTTITACYMECGRENGCQSIAMTEGAANQLPTCHLLKEDNGHYDEGIVMTTLQEIGSGQTVHGQWGCWKDISPCNATCGGGYLNRTRECDSPRPQNGGVNCTGLAHKTVKCNTHSCPDGQWGNWQISSACDVTCGGGTMNQTRKCDSPKPKHGGKDCDGSDTRKISCNEQPCPVNGQWGAWTNTSTCSVTCGGGTKDQTRKCDSPQPEHGGKDCDGDGKRKISCNEQACPVNGQWGAWTNDSACSVTCGGETIGQTRNCDSPKPKHGGKDCDGDDKRTISCNPQACPVHGGWGAWTVKAQCISPCDGNTFTKTRLCDNPPPNHGGNGCPGHDRVSFPCFKDDCKVVNIALHKPATQSSTSNKATAATDGKVDTYSMTKKQDSPWWQVDLQADVKVEYMMFRGYPDMYLADSYRNVVFRTKSTYDTDFRPCKEFKDLTSNPMKFSCVHAEKFRYIRITLERKAVRFPVNEFEVYAKPT